MTATAPAHRVDGRAKVAGTARYVDDLRPPELGWDFQVAVPVTSTCSSGRVAAVDTDAALRVPGVRLVMMYLNAPRLRKVVAASMAEIGELLPLQDDRVRYHGQCVAVVIADSLRAAQDGARRVTVRYEDVAEARAFTVADAGARLREVRRAGIAPGRIARGDALADFAAAPVRVDRTYHAAPHHHNAIEPSAVIARWDRDGGITVHAAVQWHHIDTLVIGQAFGLGAASTAPGLLARALLGTGIAGKVRLVNALAGGAFGRNLNTIHLLLACMAAKVAGRAVKVVLSREQTFSLLPYRSEVRQRLRLGAAEDGRLLTMIQEPDVAKGTAGRYVEPVGETPCQIYAHRSHLLRHRVAALDLNGAGWMRGPGVSSALFALETAMDDLARQVGVDPLELRLRNYAETNPQTGREWTGKSLRRCYEVGAEAIGWAGRPGGGTVRADGRLVGYGMATSFDLGRRFPAGARVELRRDGTAVVSVAAAEIGQGILTALTTIAAETLGLPRDRIVLRTAHTALPYAAGSIGSTGTFSNGTAVYDAALAV
ncbi:MAG TPA: molybdopterin cofactor-binding domain-containing protein, partial [Pseudonocardia sp.]|nr:molybdopterin cofactor-binding domain-containing protein [Pseudonocardia sp.]